MQTIVASESLPFDEPQVLAQINSVFVTVESSKKAIKEPGGRRVLVALPKGKAKSPVSFGRS
jgi:hypothetical protein